LHVNKFMKIYVFILLDCILVYNACTLGYWWEIKMLIIVILFIYLFVFIIWTSLSLILSFFSSGQQELSVGIFDATILFDSFTHIYNKRSINSQQRMINSLKSWKFNQEPRLSNQKSATMLKISSKVCPKIIPKEYLNSKPKL
jgi:hypothetical protein